MPWVRLDDRFPSHRKVALLSDRAFRLHVSALCWCSENLTEGAIRERELPVISRIRGVKKTAAELEEAGLWDRADDGWMIHDYLEYNPDRARVQADRESNAARQKAFRERRRAARDAARNGESNGVTHPPAETPNDKSATRRRHDGDTTEQETHAANREESQVTAIRNAVSNGTPSRPVLPSPMEKEEKNDKLATRAGFEEPSRIGDRPRIPAASAALVNALQTARLIVGWDLTSAEWLLVDALIRRCGVPALVVSATGSWQGARTQPRHARYFLPAWRSLPDAAGTADPVNLPIAAGSDVIQLGPPAHGSGPRRSTTDDRVQQALDAGRRLQALHDSQTQENQ